MGYGESASVQARGVHAKFLSLRANGHLTLDRRIQLFQLSHNVYVHALS